MYCELFCVAAVDHWKGLRAKNGYARMELDRKWFHAEDAGNDYAFNNAVFHAYDAEGNKLKTHKYVKIWWQ